MEPILLWVYISDLASDMEPKVLLEYMDDIKVFAKSNTEDNIKVFQQKPQTFYDWPG